MTPPKKRRPSIPDISPTSARRQRAADAKAARDAAKAAGTVVRIPVKEKTAQTLVGLDVAAQNIRAEAERQANAVVQQATQRLLDACTPIVTEAGYEPSEVQIQQVTNTAPYELVIIVKPKKKK